MKCWLLDIIFLVMDLLYKTNITLAILLKILIMPPTLMVMKWISKKSGGDNIFVCVCVFLRAHRKFICKYVQRKDGRKKEHHLQRTVPDLWYKNSMWKSSYGLVFNCLFSSTVSWCIYKENLITSLRTSGHISVSQFPIKITAPAN